MGVTITNPVINGPYDEPRRHFGFDQDGITDEIRPGRRRSEYFVPVPQTKKRGAQLQFDVEWTVDRIQPNDFVTQVRARVDLWRKRGYPYVTSTSRRLLEYWADDQRENRVLFAQREAAETAIYLAEAAQKDGQGWMHAQLNDTNDDYNSGLPRVALKMATGSGKTVVMAMLIAWQVLNKSATPNDKRFTRRFLVVSPGVTIRDRLRVLLPQQEDNYYRQRDLVPADIVSALGTAQIVITNYHAFLPKVTREGAGLAKATKELLLGGGGRDVADPFLESPRQVATRVAREFGLKTGELIVLNDEAHHCYREKPANRMDSQMDADETVEVKEREEQARVWFKGLQALRVKLGIKTVYDMSATPFFLNGSGYGQGTLFPWVVSDFSLIDAIECGIIKVPRLPVDDDATSERVVYRNLWDEIAADLPKRTARTSRTRTDEPSLPPKLESALYTLYANYEKAFTKWQASGERRGETPPVFIVVCNNTTVSKLVFDWIAGFEKDTVDLAGEKVIVPVAGKLVLFSNAEDGSWVHRPRTILVDSAQLESGDQLSDDFKKLATVEIEEFKSDLRVRFPGRDPNEMTEAELLREVMNTVGKPGKLGADIRCVVSVSMLTEGWDANTVTHILGVRAFRTPLLTEQVVGRGLRRRSYDIGPDGLFEPEYAEVFGIPFAFIPAAGQDKDPKPRRAPVRVHSVTGREHARIAFPRLIGYRLEMPDPDLNADFSKPQCKLRVTTEVVPTTVQVSDITGYVEHLEPEALRQMRSQEVAYRLAHRLLEREYRDELGNPRPWFFPKVLRIAKRWMAEAVDFEGGTYPGLLLLHDLTERAVEKIRHAIVAEDERAERLLPVFDVDREGSTDGVNFDTTRPAYPTGADRCHISHVVADSGWEKIIAEVLEELPGVAAYAKNDHLGFCIPYTYEGRSARYIPDFLVLLDGGSAAKRQTLIVEVSGGAKHHHSPGSVQEKADTAQHLWVPAVNRHGDWGTWSFIEIHDIAGARESLKRAVANLTLSLAST